MIRTRPDETLEAQVQRMQEVQDGLVQSIFTLTDENQNLNDELEAIKIELHHQDKVLGKIGSFVSSVELLIASLIQRITNLERR